MLGMRRRTTAKAPDVIVLATEEEEEEANVGGRRWSLEFHSSHYWCSRPFLTPRCLNSLLGNSDLILHFRRNRERVLFIKKKQKKPSSTHSLTHTTRLIDPVFSSVEYRKLFPFLSFSLMQPLPRQQQIKTTLRHQKQLLWVPLERDRPGPLGGKLATRYCLGMLGKMKAWGQWLTLRRHHEPASIAVQTDCACLCQSDDQHFPRFVSFFFSFKRGTLCPFGFLLPCYPHYRRLY